VNTATPRIRAMTMTSVYPLYVEKVEKKGRTQDELDAAITWLTGYDESVNPRPVAHLTRPLWIYVSTP
jgi:hypothetical protein